MIYLYGLLSGTAERPNVNSLSGVTGPVLCEELAQGLLVYGEHEGGQILAKRRYLLAHTRVLEALSTSGTVLPMRFGMLADDLPTVCELITEQADLIALYMEKLQGQLEFGVRIEFPKSAALSHQLSCHPSLEQERDLLLNSVQRGHFQQAEFGRRLGEALERHRTDVQRKLVADLKPIVTDLVLRAPENEYQVLNANVLIPSEQEPVFADTLYRLATHVDFAPGAEPEIRLVGPAPLYNFVQLNLAQQQEAA